MNACYALELTSMKTTNTIRKEFRTEFQCSGLWSILNLYLKLCLKNVEVTLNLD